MDINTAPDAVKWVARTAGKLAATRGIVELVVEPDANRDGGTSYRLAVRQESNRKTFATMNLTARTAEPAAILIAAALANALDYREAIGLDMDGEGLLRVIVMQDSRLGRYDPLVAAFVDAYNRATDDAMTRVERDDLDDAEGAR
jgi:phosphoenolpyruvate-protein kinase (PTS system EI component)